MRGIFGLNGAALLLAVFALVEAGVVVNVVESLADVDLVDEEKQGGKRQVPETSTDDNGKFEGLYDPECTDSLLITPTKKEVDLDVEKLILKHGGTTCHWDIIGTEDCVVQLNCKKFNLLEGSGEDPDDPCEEEYLEITDGSQGYQKFCGRDGPDLVTSGRKLRDFYVTLTMSEFKERQFACEAYCEPDRVEGKPLIENSEPEINEDCNCGRKPNSDRIVGGDDAKRGEFPWMVALVAAGTRKPYCGGSIINNRFILTAAHCFKGPYIKASNINVLLNAHHMDVTETKGSSASSYTDEELEEADRKDNSYRFTVDKYYIHPLYVRQTNDFDVALIKLDKPINFDDLKEVGPVCLPRIGQHLDSKEGVKAIISGYGLNSSDADTSMSVLQKLDVSVFADDECREFYDVRYTRRMMCAGYREGGKDSCQGDSGGPLVAEKSKQVWEQIGIVSFGEGCAVAGKPGVYINTRQVAQWIRYISNMEEAVWCDGN